MTDHGPRRRSPVIIAVLSILSLVAGATPALAAWQTTTAAPAFSTSTATLTPPITTCQSLPSQGLSPPSARLSWPAVPNATGYRVQFGSSPTATRDTTSLNYTVTGSLLLTLLGSVLTGGSVTVTVTARLENWVSAPSNTQTVVLSNLVTGLLGGLKCQGT